jgi:hypothetical protein
MGCVPDVLIGLGGVKTKPGFSAQKPRGEEAVLATLGMRTLLETAFWGGLIGRDIVEA